MRSLILALALVCAAPNASAYRASSHHFHQMGKVRCGKAFSVKLFHLHTFSFHGVTLARGSSHRFK